MNLRFICGPMSTDMHTGSIMQRFLQALRNDGTTDGLYKEIFEALTSNSVKVSESQGISSSRFD